MENLYRAEIVRTKRTNNTLEIGYFGVSDEVIFVNQYPVLIQNRV